MDDIRLNIQHLTTSGNAVTDHGEDMATMHARSDGRIETAQGGWRGRSATALGARWAAWQQTTGELLKRLSDHSHGFHSGAQGFSEFDAQRAQEMAKLTAQGEAAAELAAKQL